MPIQASSSGTQWNVGSIIISGYKWTCDFNLPSHTIQELLLTTINLLATKSAQIPQEKIFKNCSKITRVLVWIQNCALEIYQGKYQTNAWSMWLNLHCIKWICCSLHPGWKPWIQAATDGDLGSYVHTMCVVWLLCPIRAHNCFVFSCIYMPPDTALCTHETFPCRR